MPTSIARLAMPPSARGTMLPKLRLQPDSSAAGFAHHASATGNLTMPFGGLIPYWVKNIKVTSPRLPRPIRKIGSIRTTLAHHHRIDLASIPPASPPCSPGTGSALFPIGTRRGQARSECRDHGSGYGVLLDAADSKDSFRRYPQRLPLFAKLILGDPEMNDPLADNNVLRPDLCPTPHGRAWRGDWRGSTGRRPHPRAAARPLSPPPRGRCLLG